MEYEQQHGGRLLFAPSDVVFTQYDVVQPDLLYFSEARRHLVQLDTPTDAAPDLTVEVISPGTSTHDRVRKQATYARFGVREYWIVDPFEETIEIFSLDGHVYRAASVTAKHRRGPYRRRIAGASRRRRAHLRSQLSVRALPQASSTRMIRRPVGRNIKTVEADICVLGAGISGVSAALEAAKLGRTVVLVDGAPALGGQAIGSIIGTIIGLYTHGPQPYQITHGIADDLIADLTAEGSLHRRVSMTGTITFQYDEVRLGRWIERKVEDAGIHAIVGAVVTGVAFEDRRRAIHRVRDAVWIGPHRGQRLRGRVGRRDAELRSRPRRPRAGRRRCTAR